MSSNKTCSRSKGFKCFYSEEPYLKYTGIGSLINLQSESTKLEIGQYLYHSDLARAITIGNDFTAVIALIISIELLLTKQLINKSLAGILITLSAGILNFPILGVSLIYIIVLFILEVFEKDKKGTLAEKVRSAIESKYMINII